MANRTFNVAKGRVLTYVDRVVNGDGTLIVVPLLDLGLEDDAALIDHDTLADLLTSSSNAEHPIGRLTVTGLVTSVDATSETASADFVDVAWSGASGDPLGALVVAYAPTGAVDADVIPLTKHDFEVTPNGGSIFAVVDTTGFFTAYDS